MSDQRGRTAPAFPTVTLPDSGITLSIRKLSPLTIQNIQNAVIREMPAPTPPLVVVDFGEGQQEAEPNPADPDYVATVRAYENAVQQESSVRLMRLVASYSVQDIDLNAVAELRAAMQAIGAPLPDDESDAEIYVWQLACVSERDMVTLSSFVVSQSMPTEAAVQRHTATFQNAIQTPEHLGDSTPPLGVVA